MANIGARLTISPEIAPQLSAGPLALWYAAHDDGADNRINSDEVIEASGYSLTLGAITAVFQGLRKAFRNRNKSRADLDAEKEAAHINRTCGALNQMLLEYLQAAGQGALEREALDELIETLEEMHGYRKAGKLVVPGERVLSEISRAVAALNRAVGCRADLPDGDGFSRLRQLLLWQRNAI